MSVIPRCAHPRPATWPFGLVVNNSPILGFLESVVRLHFTITTHTCLSSIDSDRQLCCAPRSASTGTWTATGSLATARSDHTATLLPNGEVLVAGGSNNLKDIDSAELYDPVSGTRTATGSLITARSNHTATLLPDGMVLVVSGYNGTFGYLPSAELYDLASGTWTATDKFPTRCTGHTATLLPNGKVLVTGGLGTAGYLTSAELYNVGLDYSSDWQPQIATATFTNPAHRVQLTGSLFQGISQASGGNTQDSSSNFPVVQLRAIGNEQVSFLFVDPLRGWSRTTFSSLPPRGFVAGPALVTVFTNGIPSDAKYLVVPR
jgi:Galactose oxidase, central domain